MSYGKEVSLNECTIKNPVCDMYGKTSNDCLVCEHRKKELTVSEKCKHWDVDGECYNKGVPEITKEQLRAHLRMLARIIANNAECHIFWEGKCKGASKTECTECLIDRAIAHPTEE